MVSEMLPVREVGGSGLNLEMVGGRHAMRLVPDVREPRPFSRFDVPRHKGYLACKLAVEWTMAVLLLIGLSPLVALIAVLVKVTSHGPAFYSQTRLGKHGRRFHIYKIRTMAHNCEATTGAVWAAKNDPRITPVGRFLRATHLDEVPQLWNVVRGEMALIGPRPERPEIAARIERRMPSYGGRLMVRPGVTGLAQMRLPADSTLEGVRDKLAHDLYYVREASFQLDLRIAVSTVFHFAAEALAFGCKLLVKSFGCKAEEELCRIVFLPDEEAIAGRA